MTTHLDRLLDRSLETAFGREDVQQHDQDAPLPDRIGRYAITRRLGIGGLGAVYIGLDEELGRNVAIKILHERHSRDQVLLKHFREEAKICSQLQHPGIVPVHELGETDDGRIYYTMRVVAGETLQQILEAGDHEGSGARSNQRFLTILERAAQAVAFAHEHDIVHGDLTPANIMVGEFGEVQVLDWGLCRRTDGSSSPAPTAGRALGTPAYMAPEQAHGAKRRVDPKTDLFGLGGILCRGLTGKPPYVGDSIYQIHERAAAGSLAPTMERLDRINGAPELVALAKSSLSPDPTDRPESASLFAQTITDHLQAMETRAHRYELDAAEQRAQARSAQRARRLTTMLAASIVFAVVVTSGTWLWWRSEQQHRRSEANQRAIAALATARQLGEQAHDVEELRTALIAVDTAEVACTAVDVDPQYATQAVSLRSTLAATLTSAEHNEQTRQLLAERRWHAGDDRTAQEIEDDYRDSFARCGIDIDSGDDDQIATAVRRHQLQMELSASLHWWALKRRRAGSSGKDAWEPLLELADRCDQNTARSDLRRAFLAGDIAQLRALAASNEAVQLAPETIDLLGQFLMYGGDRDAAVNLYRRAHVRHPSDYELCHDLANELIRAKGEQDEIVALMTTGAALRPDNAHALTDLAIALIEAGRHDDARPIVDRLLELAPDYSRVWICASVLRHKDKDLPGALAAIRRYVKLERPGGRPQWLLARMLHANGLQEEALAASRRAVAANATLSEAHELLGLLLAERYEFAEAIDVLRRVLPTSKRRAQVCLMLGSALSMCCLHDEAYDLLSEAVKRLPNNSAARFHLSMTLAGIDQLDEAIEHLVIVSRSDSSFTSNATELLARFRDRRLLQPRLESFMAGEETAEPATLEQLADQAMAQGSNGAAARFFRLLDEHHPERKPLFASRWARAAAKVAFLDDEVVSDDDRLLLASEALQFSREMLAKTEAQVDAGVSPITSLKHFVSMWQRLPEFAPTRDTSGLDWLPANERKEWLQFWRDLEAAKTW